MTINFKIPVIFQDKIHPKGGGQVVVDPPKSGRKTINQNTPVRDYSTVTDLFPTTPNVDSNDQCFSLSLSVELKSSNLWVSNYSPYQQELFNIISKYHDEEGWNFQQISDYLVDNNYRTPRGKIFTQGHVWSIYKKKIKSITRFSREFDHIITDMKVDQLN